MTNSENPVENDEPTPDLFRPLIQYRRLIWQGSLAAVAVVALLGGLYVALQPTAWTAALGFRPVFTGADEGRYPNGLPFGATDITDMSVIAQVYAKNNLQPYCNIDEFRSGFVVQESSAALQLLSLEYQALLAETRLTVVDRQRLQDEFTSRRRALPREYRLVFIRPLQCASLPQEVVLKALAEVLERWAVESQERRGVLKVRSAVLSPAVFDLPDADNISLLVRADLVRGGIVRVIANIKEVEALSGSELTRIGENRVTLAEVHLRLEDLMRARLEPLIGMAGRGLGRDSVQWVAQALETASAQLRAAETRTEAYRRALREYSIGPTSPTAGSATENRAQQSSDVQALTPQIDRTFIAGIVALSEKNTQFRQEITRRVIDTSIEAAAQAEVVEHYRSLLASMKDTSGAFLSSDQVRERLATISAEAKEATRQFNQIYDEYSRVAFRASTALYRVEQPTVVTAVKSFSVRGYLILLLAVALASPVILAIACLVLFHLRSFIKSALPA